MRFHDDKNFPSEIVSDLRTAGHAADTVCDEGLGGVSAAVIPERAQREGRILFTLDKGIADVRIHPPEKYPGVVRFRPAAAGRGCVLAFVRRNLAEVLRLSAPGRLCIVSERGLRVR